MATFITSEQSFIILTLLCASAYVGILFDRLNLVKAVPGVVITMICGALLGNLNILPLESSVYDWIWDYFIPLAIPFILLRMPLKDIFCQTGPMLWAFLIGSVGTVLGGLLAYRLVTVGPESWKIVSMFTGSYIGGSINLVSVSKIFDLQDKDLFLAGNAADNVLMALYFVALSFWGSKCDSKLKLNTNSPPLIAQEDIKKKMSVHVHWKSLILGLMVSCVFLMAVHALSYRFDVKAYDILLITLLTLIFGQLFPKISKQISAHENVGYFFLQVFFAVIGVSCSFVSVVHYAPKLFGILLVMLSVQFVFIVLATKLFRLGFKEAVIAANALAGGPATALAMANNHKWHHLVGPAVLCGTFGYSVGTFIAVSLGAYLR